MIDLVRDVRALLGKPPKKPLHFRDLRHEHRLPFLDRIAGAELSTISILTHKPSLTEPAKFRGGSRLHHYNLRYLLERVCWLCRDARSKDDTGDGSVELVFSNRKTMSYDDIRNYLDGLIANEALKLGGERIHDIRLSGDIIKTSQIQTFTSGKRAGLQIADAVASSCFYGLEPSRVGFIESRYVEMLKPVIYTRGGKTLSYGMKFFPVGIDQIANEDTRLKWVENHFK